MSLFAQGLRSIDGISPHTVLCGLGLETDDHSTGMLCGTTALSLNGLLLDDTVVYEAGQAAGQLSPARAQRLAAGIVFAGAEIQTVVAYLQLAPGAATLAQTQGALQAFMRVVRKLVQ